MKCQEFNLKKISSHPQEEYPKLLKSPKERRSIDGDGNCFFRCISYALSGSEEEHMLMRENVIQFMLNVAACCLYVDANPPRHMSRVLEWSISTFGHQRLKYSQLLAFSAPNIQVHSSWGEGNTGDWQWFAARETNPQCIPEKRAIYIDLCNSHFTYVVNVCD